MTKAVHLKQVISIAVISSMICTMLSPSAEISFAEEERYVSDGTSVSVPEDTGDYVIMSEGKPNSDCEKIADTDNAAVYVSDSGKAKGDDAVIEENISFEASEASSEEGIWITSDDAEKVMEDHNADWNIDMINADIDDTFASENTGSVKIAALDSGVDFAACDANVTKAVNLVEDEQNYENMLNDISGHGSAVASIISRIDPEAEIYSVRVLDKDNKGTLSRVVSGIYWCIENDVDIINMSFGTDSSSEILDRAVKDAKEHGILMVSAAGNDPDKDVQYPARLDDVMSVGSVDSNGETSENNASGDLDVLAPGESIFTQSALGLYTVVSGTSMAAPHAAAAAALLWEEDRNKSEDFITGLITDSANTSNTDENYEAGIIDIEYAKEIYDEYEEDAEEVPANENEINTFADGEVNASWKGHDQLATYGLDHTQSGQSLNNDEKNAFKRGAMKSLFVYGIALHNVTDTFAHASYGHVGDNRSNPIRPIVHEKEYNSHTTSSINGADLSGVAPNRWADSQYASKKVVNKAVAGARGKISDFDPEDTTKNRLYYLSNLSNKAKKIDGNNHTAFKYINADVSGSLYTGTVTVYVGK